MNKENFPNLARNAKMLAHALEEVQTGTPLLDLCRKRYYRYTRINNAISHKITATEMMDYAKALEMVSCGKTQAEACRELNLEYSRFNKFVNSGIFKDIDDSERDLFYEKTLTNLFGKNHGIAITNHLKLLIDNFYKETLDPTGFKVYELRVIDRLMLAETRSELKSIGIDCTVQRIRVIEDKISKKGKHPKLKSLIEDHLANYIQDAKCIAAE